MPSSPVVCLAAGPKLVSGIGVTLDVGLSAPVGVAPPREVVSPDSLAGVTCRIVDPCTGGCTTPGDVAKAFCGGADFVMLGGMLAGHDETGTEFYGMSSNKAQEKYGGELKDYRASEGREVTVESKGPLKNTIREILGGLRSACTYIGATELKNAPKCATFVKTERQYNTMYGT